MWDEITCLFPNITGCTVEVWEWTSHFTPHFTGACYYLSMLGLMLIHVSKRGPRATLASSPNWFVKIQFFRLARDKRFGNVIFCYRRTALGSSVFTIKSGPGRRAVSQNLRKTSRFIRVTSVIANVSFKSSAHQGYWWSTVAVQWPS